MIGGVTEVLAVQCTGPIMTMMIMMMITGTIIIILECIRKTKFKNDDDVIVGDTEVLAVQCTGPIMTMMIMMMIIIIILECINKYQIKK